LAGADEIFIGFRTIQRPSTGVYAMQVMGFTAYLDNEISCFKLPGAVALDRGAPYVPLWDDPMPMWISGSGRMVTFAVKVSSIYEGGYAGFMLPDCPPSQYPYPLAIGGSMSANSTNYRYDFVGAAHSIFNMPGSETSTFTDGNNFTSSSLMIMQPSGQWEFYKNRPAIGGGSESILDTPTHSVLPHGSYSQKLTPLQNVGGGFLIENHVIYNAIPVPSRFLGTLDKTVQISGSGNSSENTGTFDGKDYIVFGNAYRTTIDNYWGMEIE